ncbi:MAG TPA: cupin domain-containing protein [Acidimicrobiales bacterium]|nr:cupin domain-containing protein [Acidimicrobiales bacterium]
MPVLPAPTAPVHEIEGARFRSLATPSRGAAETAVWQVEIAPGTPATPHSLTREEIFHVVAGEAAVTLGGAEHAVAAGDTIVVPPDVAVAIANPGAAPLRMLCVQPVGGQARLADGTVFSPPWTV